MQTIIISRVGRLRLGARKTRNYDVFGNVRDEWQRETSGLRNALSYTTYGVGGSSANCEWLWTVPRYDM